MATLNVFELTNEELNKSKKTTAEESVKKSSKKAIKESAKRISKKSKKVEKLAKKIPYNKIKLESLRFVMEAEENDEIIDYTPEEDVVLVIDPEMEETPATEEEAEEAAEELVGDLVCKCAICGANYICDCDELTTEDLESEDAECPICGETGEQIIIGEITPTEEVADDEAEEDDEAEDDDVEEVEVVDDAEVVDDFADDEFEEDEFEDDEFVGAEEEDEDDEFGESISRAKNRTALRREAAARRRSAKMEAKKPMAKKSMTRMPKRPVTEKKTLNLDEVTLNRMLTKFAKENYDNVRFVKVTNGKYQGSKLTLEATVLTKKGSKQRTKFVCENFKLGKVINAKFTETGVFTEGKSNRPAFIVDFKTLKNVVTPVSLRYSYKVTENKNKYLVSGKVMNESFKRTK